MHIAIHGVALSLSKAPMYNPCHASRLGIRWLRYLDASSWNQDATQHLIAKHPEIHLQRRATELTVGLNNCLDQGGGIETT